MYNNISAAAPEQARDSYGFEVKKEYQKLHSKYAPLWEKEEEERRQRWSDFLDNFHVDSTSETKDAGHTEGEAALEAALLHLQASKARKEDLPWWQQLRTLVQAGVPMSLRGRLWKTFLQVNSRREPGLYSALVSEALAPQYQNSRMLGDPSPLLEPVHLKGASSDGDNHFSAHPSQHQVNGESFLEEPSAPVKMELESKGSSQDWNVQIEKDLHRTFPGHPVMDRSGRRSLRRILAAYACRNSAVGYCQGMNFVAGCLLLFMDEEDAFWCLTDIVEQLLPGYFSTTMVAPQVDQLVFKQLVDAQFPRLTAHLDSLGVNVASVSTQWFLCVFVNSLPLETCLRVWDLFLFEKCSSVLFRVALALVDIYAQALVATVDAIDAFSLLQNMAPLSFDSSRLVDVACIAYAHVDHEHMDSLRADFQEPVHAQVQERLSRAKLEADRYKAANGSKGGSNSDDIDVPKMANFATFLPRIQVASPRSQDAAFHYSWEDAKTPLHLDTSKAAATAYKIASSPAAPSAPNSDSKASSSSRTRSQEDRDYEQAGMQTGPVIPPAAGSNLGSEVRDVLDRRKQGLLDTHSMREEERDAVVQQLMDLVARLEEEMFQAEARRFEAENTSAELLTRVEDLRSGLQQKAESMAEKHEILATLKERHGNEAVGVIAGSKRCLQFSTSLQSAQAHRALRASLLTEKKELIANLQQELGQVSARTGNRLLQKLGFQGRGKD